MERGRLGRVLPWAAFAVLLTLGLPPGSGGAAEPAEHISSIKADFRPDEYATHYTVEVTGFPQGAAVRWTLELTCVDTGCPDSSGTLTDPKPNVDPSCNNNGLGIDEPHRSSLGSDPPEFVWHHPAADQNPSDTYHCNHAREGPRGHQGLITIVVRDGSGYSCTATYKGSKSSTPTSVRDGTATEPLCGTTVAPECMRGVEITKRVIDGLEWDKYKSVFNASSDDSVTTFGPNEIAVGKNNVFRFLIRVKNGGSCTLHDVDVRDELPLGFTPVDNYTVGKETPIVNTKVDTIPGRPPTDTVLPEIHGLSTGADQVSYTFPVLEPGQEGRIFVGGYMPEGGDFVNQARVVAPAELGSNKVTLHVTPNPYISKINAKPKKVGGDATDEEGDRLRLGRIAGATPPLWRLKHVEVAIRVLSGAGRQSCRWLESAAGGWSTATERFGGCEQPIWLRAEGTRHWVLRLHGLPSGRYLVRARATNVAKITGRYKQRTFSVR